MERGLRRKTPIIEWDTFLNQPLAHNIQFSEEGITADIDCNICKYPNECENCARAIEDRKVVE